MTLCKKYSSLDFLLGTNTEKLVNGFFLNYKGLWKSEKKTGINRNMKINQHPAKFN